MGLRLEDASRILQRNLLSYLFILVEDTMKSLGVFLHDLETLDVNFQISKTRRSFGARSTTHINDVHHRALSCISGSVVDWFRNTQSKDGSRK